MSSNSNQSEVGFSTLCKESVGNITPQSPNAYILQGTTEYFKCTAHSAATFEWIATIDNVEFGVSATPHLNRNGVSWMTNMSYSILTFDSHAGSKVTGIECKIILDDGQNVQQCSIYIDINIYGK